jgi:hypothetical protein
VAKPRVEADRAELARAQRSAVGVDEAHRRADPLVATVTSLTGRHGQAADTEPWMACYAALAQAEWSRLEGRLDPDAWQRAAEHWERLENQYAAAYARFRQAETLLGVRAPGPRSGRCSGPRTRPRWRWERGHCAARSSCWPTGAA